jgi:hypothetical protein
MFKRLQSLLHHGRSELETRLECLTDFSKTEEKELNELDSVYLSRLEKALQVSIGINEYTRTLELSDSDVYHLKCLLALAKTELDCRMTSVDDLPTGTLTDDSNKIHHYYRFNDQVCTNRDYVNQAVSMEDPDALLEWSIGVGNQVVAIELSGIRRVAIMPMRV